MIGGDDSFYLKFWVRWSEIADFQSIFARSASAVIPSEKSSNNTDHRKSTVTSNNMWSFIYSVRPAINNCRQYCVTDVVNVYHAFSVPLTVFSALVLKAILSVRPSVRHTRDSRRNVSVYRNAFCVTR